MSPSRAPALARGAWAVRVGLLTVIAAYAALAVTYSFATRLRWGPDEPGHIAYIESLALDGRFPAMGEADVYRPGAAVSHQVQQPPLYYLLGAVIYRLALPLSPDLRMRVLRFFSATLGVLTLGLLWRLSGRVIDGDDWMRVAAVAALAFAPIFGYMGGVVNNDALVVPLCLAAFWRLTTARAEHAGVARCALVGLLAGLAILTKEVALALLPVIAVGMLLPRQENTPRLAQRTICAAAALGAALAVACPWWVRNTIVFGHPMVYAYVKPPFSSLMEVLVRLDVAARIAWVWMQLTFRTLWSPYWAVKGVIPRDLYLAAAGLLGGSAAAGLLMMWGDHVRRTLRLAGEQVQTLGLLVLFPALVAAGVIRYTFLVDYRTVEGGRYLLVTWPCLALLGTLGWARLAGRFRRVALATLVGLWLMADVTVLWAVGRTYGVW